jgi:hypothetical protein
MEWTLSGLPSWIQVNKSSGTPGNTKVTLSIEENKGVQSRSADITFTGSGATPISLKVTQSGAAPYLQVDKTSLTANPGGQKDSVIITSNDKWTLAVATGSGWIQTDRVAGDSGTSKVFITTSANSSATSQSGEIIVSSTSPGVPAVRVNISQAGFSLTTFSPQKGPYKTVVTLTGSFGPNPTVTLNDVPCTIASASINQITFPTPAGATTGKIKVSFGSARLTTATDFTVTNTWVKVADAGFNGLFPNAPNIQGGVSFVWDNKIFFGLGTYPVPGATSITQIRSFRVFDPATNNWSQGFSLPTAMVSREDAGCVVENGVAYMGLGRLASFASDYWAFNLTTGVWKQLPSFSTGSIAPITFEVNNNVYVGQPAYEKGILKKYIPASSGSGFWQNATSSFPQLQSSLCFTIGSLAYIVGGMGQTTGAFGVQTTYSFDPNTNNVKRLGDHLLYPGLTQGSGVCGVINGKAYILGWQQFYEYDPANDTWIDLQSTATPDTNGITGYQSGVVNNVLYVWRTNGTMYKYIPL